MAKRVRTLGGQNRKGGAIRAVSPCDKSVALSRRVIRLSHRTENLQDIAGVSNEKALLDKEKGK
jgi:hypothetical protein